MKRDLQTRVSNMRNLVLQSYIVSEPFDPICPFDSNYVADNENLSIFKQYKQTQDANQHLSSREMLAFSCT